MTASQTSELCSTPENANAPWVLQGVVCHQLRARPRLSFLQLRPRQPLPPSRFELRFGLVERCRVAAVRISAGLPKCPSSDRNQRMLSARRAARSCAPWPNSRTVDNVVLPVLSTGEESPSLLAAATIALTLTATTDVSAQWRRRGWGWYWRRRSYRWTTAEAIIASRPQGYVVYPGYAQPVYGPGCYWASQPVYDVAGRVVGYTGRPVQVCPGYVAPPPPGAAGLRRLFAPVKMIGEPAD